MHYRPLVAALFAVSLSGCAYHMDGNTGGQSWFSSDVSTVPDGHLVAKGQSELLVEPSLTRLQKDSRYRKSLTESERMRQQVDTNALATMLRDLRDKAMNDPSPTAMARYRAAFTEVMQNAYNLSVESEKPPAPTARDRNDQELAARQLVSTALPQGFIAMKPKYTQIHFEFNSSRLAVKWREILDSNAEHLMSHPDMVAQVAGYADSRGDMEYNLWLGKRRAQKVANALIDRGVRPEQLAVVSYGLQNPVAAGTSETDYAMNRRVEIMY